MAAAASVNVISDQRRRNLALAKRLDRYNRERAEREHRLAEHNRQSRDDGVDEQSDGLDGDSESDLSQSQAERFANEPFAE